MRDEFEYDDSGNDEPLDRDAALSKLKAPAIGIISAGVTGLLSLVLMVFADAPMRELCTRFADDLEARGQEDFAGIYRHYAEIGLANALNIAVTLLPSVFTLWCGLQMLRGKRWAMAFAGCIVSIVPFTCGCCLGIPFGIWGLMVLSNNDVKRVFQ